MNDDEKLLNKMFAKCIQEYMKNIIHSKQIGSIQGCRDDSVYENPSK